jgi:hypothetical protein
VQDCQQLDHASQTCFDDTAQAPEGHPCNGTFGAPPARRADRRLGTPDRLDQRCRSVRVGRGPGRRPRNIDDADDRVPSDTRTRSGGWRSGASGCGAEPRSGVSPTVAFKLRAAA